LEPHDRAPPRSFAAVDPRARPRAHDEPHAWVLCAARGPRRPLARRGRKWKREHPALARPLEDERVVRERDRPDPAEHALERRVRRDPRARPSEPPHPRTTLPELRGLANHFHVV